MGCQALLIERTPADIIVSLGLDEADAQRSNLEVYKEHFQEHFIAATQAYYKAESTDFVANNSVSDYMKKAEDRLQEEADRVNLYLNDTTKKDVSRLDAIHRYRAVADFRSSRRLARRRSLLLTRTLLSTSSSRSSTPTRTMVIFQKLDDCTAQADRIDLTRMYGLLMRIPNGLEPLRKKFEEHVKLSGCAAVQKIMPTPAAGAESSKTESVVINCCPGKAKEHS